jgi:hypothetical protein
MSEAYYRMNSVDSHSRRNDHLDHSQCNSGDVADDHAADPHENAMRTFVASVECKPGLMSVKSAKLDVPGCAANRFMAVSEWYIRLLSETIPR